MFEAKNFTSRCFYSYEPITEIPEYWVKNHNNKEEHNFLLEGIKSKKLAIIQGEGFSIRYKSPHDCGCEYCDHMEHNREMYSLEKEAIKRFKELEKLEEYEDVDIRKDCYLFKIVKQEKGELFE